jgi:sec-independent protein translocase protein TatA
VLFNFAFLPNVGVPELLIVLAIVILILGPKRIPAAFRSIGQGVRGFRDTAGGGDGDEGRKAALEEQNKTEVHEQNKTEVHEQNKTEV